MEFQQTLRSPCTLTCTDLNTGNPWLWFSVLCWQLIFAGQALATVWHVPTDHATIESALAISLPGDTVQVACGEYYEYGLQMKSGVVLRSETGLAGCAVIDAEEQGMVISCLNLSLPTRIEGFTLRGGFDNNGAAINCIESDLTVINCMFTANTSHSAGGAFYSTSCGPTLETCVFVDNHALYGGGCYAGYGNPTFIACAFVANTAEIGGGLLCNSRCFAKITGCVFSGNIVQAHGGGVSCMDNSSGVFEECLFQENITGIQGGGAAMSIINSSPHLMSTTFRGNSTMLGGAVYCYGSDAHFTYCLFTDNEAQATGTALAFIECNPFIQNCTFVENSLSARPVIYVGVGSSGRFHRCNIAFGTGPAFECYPRMFPTLQQCNIFGNQGGDWTGNIADQADTTGNLSLDPMFCDLPSGDLRHCADSMLLPENNPEEIHVGSSRAGCDRCGARFTAILLGSETSPGASQGVNLIDCDRDGDLDIYVVSNAQPNLLWENRGPGVFQETACDLLNDPGASTAAAWADYDNDGLLDLYISRSGQANSLLHNEGDGVFTDATGFGLDNPGAGRGVSWADFDRDGLLDLYLVNHNEPNVLFRSLGDMGTGWIFLPQSGVMSDDRPGVCAAWCDFDNDNDLDLYLTNEYEPNLLLRNDHPLGFTDASGSGALADYHNGQGVAWGDYDNNGYFDLYLVNAGQEDRLFKGNSSGLTLVAETGLEDGGHGRGATWGDFDNDGDLDLYLARYDQQDLLYENLGNDHFETLPVISTARVGNTNAVACGDLNGDGRLDLCLVQENDPDYVLINDLGIENHWLQIKLVGTTSNRTGIGTHLRLVSAGQSQVRQITCGTGHFSQNPPWAHFGLGEVAVADSLVVHWPSGVVQVLTNIPADRTLTIVEMAGSTPVEDAADQPRVFQLHNAFPNPFNPQTTIAYDLPRTLPVLLSIHDLAGRLIMRLVAGELQPAGQYSVRWNGCDHEGMPVAAGVYTCLLQAGSYRQAQRLVLIK